MFPFLNVTTHIYQHFGQNNGKQISSISSSACVRVFLPQRGQSRKLVMACSFCMIARLRPKLPQLRILVMQHVRHRVHGGFSEGVIICVSSCSRCASVILDVIEGYELQFQFF